MSIVSDRLFFFLNFFFVLCFTCRSGKHDVNDVMSYDVQNDEDSKRMLLCSSQNSYYNCVHVLSSHKVVKKLPGIRKYVDPQNYASPDLALKDFTLEIPSHQLRLDEVIGGGELTTFNIKVYNNDITRTANNNGQINSYIFGCIEF